MRDATGSRELTLIVGTAVLYALWEVISHHFLMDLPMPLFHAVSGGVSLLVTLLITALATRGLVRQQRRLQELARLRDELTHMVIHDMRSPLTVVIGALSTLRARGGTLPGPLAEMVTMASDGSQRLLGMVDNLLEVSRLEGGMPPDLRDTDVRALVGSTVAGVRPLAEEYGMAFDIRVDPDVPSRVTLDADKIRRVLENLLVNALKFTPDGRDAGLRVAALDHGRRLVFEVWDHGVGIPADDLPHIFEKFYRGSKTGRMRSTGLGLTFCRLAVEAHGGRIEVRSREGEGTVFTVELPAVSTVVTGAPDVAPTTREADLAAGRGARLTALIALALLTGLAGCGGGGGEQKGRRIFALGGNRPPLLITVPEETRLVGQVDGPVSRQLAVRALGPGDRAYRTETAEDGRFTLAVPFGEPVLVSVVSADGALEATLDPLPDRSGPELIRTDAETVDLGRIRLPATGPTATVDVADDLAAPDSAAP